MSRSRPLPRFRIYTEPRNYRHFAWPTVFARSDAVEQFEASVRQRCAVACARAVPRGRSGIFLALRALITPGQRVILSPYTIYEVVNMVICAGGVPVFADIEPETCNLDPDRALELINEETGAVLVTHLHGLGMDLAELADRCRERGVALLEDAAQAFGARVNGRHVGTFGDAGIYSFGMYKNLTTFLGGMVVSPHRELDARIANDLAGFPAQSLTTLLAEAARALAADVATFPPLFRSVVYPLFRFGYLHDIEFLNKRVRVQDNARLERTIPADYLSTMRPVQATIGLGQLQRVDADTSVRIGFARLYHEGLQDLDELRLPPMRDDGSHTYAYYPIQFSNRHRLVRHAMKAGRDLAVQHLKNCADLPCFDQYRRDCPNARATAEQTILLPTYPRYSRDDIERNVAAIRNFFGRRGKGGI